MAQPSGLRRLLSWFVDHAAGALVSAIVGALAALWVIPALTPDHAPRPSLEAQIGRVRAGLARAGTPVVWQRFMRMRADGHGTVVMLMHAGTLPEPKRSDVVRVYSPAGDELGAPVTFRLGLLATRFRRETARGPAIAFPDHAVDVDGDGRQELIIRLVDVEGPLGQLPVMLSWKEAEQRYAIEALTTAPLSRRRTRADDDLLGFIMRSPTRLDLGDGHRITGYPVMSFAVHAERSPIGFRYAWLVAATGPVETADGRPAAAVAGWVLGVGRPRLCQRFTSLAGSSWLDIGFPRPVVARELRELERYQDDEPACDR